jgi:ribonuclease T1
MNLSFAHGRGVCCYKVLQFSMRLSRMKMVSMGRTLHFLSALLLLCLPLLVQAHDHHQIRSGDTLLSLVSEAGLPPAARTTLRLIKQGGPFPFRRDGVVFGNYEHLLPQQPRGYYHEYTVPTPGVHNRGARRIVCGPLPECYYSGNHYRTFQRIRE